MPALRDRPTDIPLFIDHFRFFFAAKFGVEPWTPDAATQARFMRYRWPGNVRQLAQVIERVYALDAPPLLPADAETATVESAVVAPAVAPAGSGSPLPGVNLDELRKLAVRQALAMTEGHKGKAAMKKYVTNSGLLEGTEAMSLRSNDAMTH